MKTKIVAANSHLGIRSLALWVVGLAFTTFIFVPVPAAAQCNQLFAKYEGSSWWWGAFGHCKKYGGTVNRNEVFECAWKQVPTPENTMCLKEKLRTSPSTKKGIDAVVAANSLPCDKLYAKYEGSSWWWGAFGNCKKYGGTVDRNNIFECAWKQVPAPENTTCLKEKLRSSPSTKKGIDAVVAANSLPCDKLYAKYEGSSWWWGAFGNCKKPGGGGTVDQNEIFECAWKQVPAPENTACLKEKLRLSTSTSKGIEAVASYNKCGGESSACCSGQCNASPDGNLLTCVSTMAEGEHCAKCGKTDQMCCKGSCEGGNICSGTICKKAPCSSLQYYTLCRECGGYKSTFEYVAACSLEEAKKIVLQSGVNCKISEGACW
jgi:hypothetical protein